MKLRFTSTALRQLDGILNTITDHHPIGARNVQERIREVCYLLLDHPFMGLKTERRNIRRIVISPYPYLLTYRVGTSEVVIRTIRHTSRRPLS
ncbi:type II toxin-antitoxin system RelE/ParE family toxin [Methylobacterium sp. NFXW15]|uniref:type II toxin-antitoxin system RelE/ParE family toxin n=1 Tax=Methylobacterium sp. NFXW15 TaxID=2819512 RepID=UPI003CF2C124